MTSKEFTVVRKTIGKTQKQIARLLGISIKAVHSYEQEWRSVPDHIEKQMLLLATSINTTEKRIKDCWTINRCPNSRKTKCPAWEFKRGNICWLINGTICKGKPLGTWKEKIRICRSCKVLTSRLPPQINLFETT